MRKGVRTLTILAGAVLAVLMLTLVTLDAASACGADVDTIAPSSSAASLAGETLGNLICEGD